MATTSPAMATTQTVGSKETKLYMHKEAMEFEGYSLQIKAMARRKTITPNVQCVLTTDPKELVQNKTLEDSTRLTAQKQRFFCWAERPLA